MRQCTAALSMASQPSSRFQTDLVVGTKSFTHGMLGSATFCLNSMSGHSTSKLPQSWTDPITPASNGSDEGGSDDSDGSDQIILKLEEDEEGWAILPAMGKHSLEQLNGSSDSMWQKITVSHHQLGWRCI